MATIHAKSLIYRYDPTHIVMAYIVMATIHAKVLARLRARTRTRTHAHTHKGPCA